MSNTKTAPINGLKGYSPALSFQGVFQQATGEKAIIVFKRIVERAKND